MHSVIATLCPKKDIIDCSLKKDDQTLIVFGTNTPDTTGHQMTVQVPTSPNVCFCTTSGNHNKLFHVVFFKIIIIICYFSTLPFVVNKDFHYYIFIHGSMII